MTTGFARGTPAYRRTVAAFFLAGFATFALLYGVQPLLPEMTRAYGISVASASLAVSLSTACLALSIFVLGAVAETTDRQRVMIAAMGLAALIGALTPFASDWPLFLAGRAAEGLALGGVPSVAMACLAERIEARSLPAAMGLYVGGTALGGMFGRVFTGALSGFLDWRLALMSDGVLCLALTLCFALLIGGSEGVPAGKLASGIEAPLTGFARHLHAWSHHLADTGQRRLFVIGGLALGVFVTLFNYIDFRLEAPPFTLSPQQGSAVFLSYAVGVVAAPVAGHMTARLGRRMVMLIGVGALATGALMTLPDSLAMIAIGFLFVTAGFFVVHAVASGWVGHLAARDRGHASALYLLFYYCGASLMGTISGLFWHEGWGAIVLFALVFVVLMALLALRVPEGGRP